MSLNFTNDSHFEETDLPVIQYRIWTLWDRKGTTLLILFSTGILCAAVYFSTEKVLLCIISAVLLLGSVWRIFIPLQYELTTTGIIRWTFGRRRDIPWSEIRSYVIQEEGILILPHRNRYPLDAFRGLFIPVPKRYRVPVHRRFTAFAVKAQPFQGGADS